MLGELVGAIVGVTGQLEQRGPGEDGRSFGSSFTSQFVSLNVPLTTTSGERWVPHAQRLRPKLVAPKKARSRNLALDTSQLLIAPLKLDAPSKIEPTAKEQTGKNHRLGIPGIRRKAIRRADNSLSWAVEVSHPPSIH